jgi:drug/metabolite transporter (DMT)-like permease
MTAGAGRAGARHGHLAMLAFSLIVAVSFTLGGMVANDITPTALTTLRFVAAAALLAGASALVRTARGRAPERGDLAAPWRWLVLGTLFAFYFVAMFEGLKTAPPVAISAVFTLTPLMTAVAAWAILGQRLRADLALALTLGAAGAVWVIFRGDPARLMALEVGRGEAIFALGCALHAIFTPLMRRWNRGEPALVSTALVMAAGAAVLIVYGFRDLLATDWAALPWRVWPVLAWLVVMSSAAALLLLQYAGQRLPSSKVMAYSYLSPAWVVVLDLALGQALPWTAILPGIALLALTQALLLRED